MPKKLEEITIIYRGDRMRFENANGDVIVGNASMRTADGEKLIAIKGTAEEDEPAPHMSYRLYGSWTTYTHPKTKQTEDQFVFKTFVRSAPHSRAGIVKYLEKAPNIGRVLAARLWEKFKGDAVRVLREQPDVAAVACEKLSVDGAQEAARWLADEQAIEDCTIELIDLFDGRGFRKSLARDVVREFGNRAAPIIKKNPYILQRFRGCGFKKADALYLDLGGRPDALKRQAYCATYAVTSATSQTGDTWHYVGVAVAGLKGSVGGSALRLRDALNLAQRGEILARVWTDGREGPPSWDGSVEWVSDIRKARNETRLAEYVAEALAEPPVELLPTIEELFEKQKLTEHQIENLYKAVNGGALGVLGGSPGTGKTFTAAVYIKRLIDKYGAESIAVAAPTGKAAVRITEAMQSYGVPLRARTIHSLLKVQQADDRGGWSFCYGRDCPLPYMFIVVDEGSMVDCDLMASLFAARSRGTRVLIVGDINQLAPVGHGAPLRDMIAAGVPYGELREIHRNDGGIVQACADIRDGRVFQFGGNLIHGGGRGPDQQIELMLQIIGEAAHEHRLNRVWDIQVLVPVNKRSKLSRKELNGILQKALNTNPEIQGTPFRLADKIVNTKNGFYPAAKDDEPVDPEVQTNESGDVYVANGELGEVVRIEPKFLEVKLSSPPRLIRVPRGAAKDSDDESDEESSGTGCNWDLAYSLSVHKSQGSEWPVVIVMIDDYPGARSICDRSWIYTAISRAKKLCYLVGSKATADRFCRANNIAKRKTFLKELIHDSCSQHAG